MMQKKCLLDIVDDINDKLKKGWTIEPDDFEFVQKLKNKNFTQQEHDKAIIIEAELMKHPQNELNERKQQMKELYKIEGKIEKRNDKYYIMCQNIQDMVEYFEGKHIQVTITENNLKINADIK